MIDVTCFNWIKMIQKSVLGSQEKYVAHYLSTYMNQNQDVAWPSQARIVNEMGIGKSTLNRALNKLEVKGWIVRERGNPTTNTRYLINVPTDAVQTLALGGSPTAGLVPQRDKGSTTAGLGVVPQRDTNNKVITKNNKMGKFVPPTLDECIAYANEKKFVLCPKHFFEFYSAGDWHDSYGTPVKNWKQKYITRNKDEVRRNGQYNSTQPNTEAPIL
jgi:hypothetical protein